MTAFSGKSNVTVWRPSVRLSVCPFFLASSLIRDSPGAACDAASVHFLPVLRGQTYLFCLEITI